MQESISAKMYFVTKGVHFPILHNMYILLISATTPNAFINKST